MNELRVIEGSRDLIEVLEEAIAGVRSGQVVAVTLCRVLSDSSIDNVTAWKDDFPARWALIVTSVLQALQRLMTEGLVKS